MMDHPFVRELRATQRAGRAVVAVNVYDAVQALAVADAADIEQLPVILQTGSGSFSVVGEEPLAAAVLAVRESRSRLSIHLDHSRDPDEIKRCLDRGYDSVMIDGSHLPFAENVARTAETVELAHSYDAWVEAELGALPGDEDRSTSTRVGHMTDPADAATFVEATGADVLAVAIGNVHGVPAAPVHLSLERLAEIRDAVEVPLVLHGASGLPDDEVLAAISIGVCKINVNTEVRRAYLRAIHESLNDSDNDDLVGHFHAGRLAATDVVRNKIRLFGRSHQPLASGAQQ